MVCRLGAQDEEIHSWLKDEGFEIAKAGLVRIRKEMGLRRREDGREAQEQADNMIRQLIQ